MEFGVRICHFRRQVTIRRFVLRASVTLEFTRSPDHNLDGSANSKSATKEILAWMQQNFCEIAGLPILLLWVPLQELAPLQGVVPRGTHRVWLSRSDPSPHLRLDKPQALDCISSHSSDHRLCPSTSVPTRRTPMCVRESFHRSVNMFVQALSNDKVSKAVDGQVPDGSLEGSSAPRILDPEHAQV